MICPGFSLRPGSKLRELPVAARQGQFAIGDEREREFLPEYGSGGAASRGSGDGRKNAAPGEQLSERAADWGSNDRGRGVGGRTFTMFHGTSWRSWQNIRRHARRGTGSPQHSPAPQPAHRFSLRSPQGGSIFCLGSPRSEPPHMYTYVYSGAVHETWSGRGGGS